MAYFFGPPCIFVLLTSAFGRNTVVIIAQLSHFYSISAYIKYTSNMAAWFLCPVQWRHCTLCICVGWGAKLCSPTHCQLIIICGPVNKTVWTVQRKIMSGIYMKLHLCPISEPSLIILMAFSTLLHLNATNLRKSINREVIKKAWKQKFRSNFNNCGNTSKWWNTSSIAVCSHLH